MKLISPGLVDIETRHTNNGAGYRWMAASESTRRTSRRVRTSESMVRGLSSGSGSTVLDDLFGEMSRLQLSPVRPKTYQFCREMVFDNFLLSFSVGQMARCGSVRVPRINLNGRREVHRVTTDACRTRGGRNGKMLWRWRSLLREGQFTPWNTGIVLMLARSLAVDLVL